MAPKRTRANYSALFSAGAAIQPGAFPKAPEPTPSDEELAAVQMISVDDLLDNPYQPRENMDEESLQQLVQTIKDQGFQGVLVARPHPTQSRKYQITAGHRRRDSARLAGLKDLPVIVKEIADQDMAVLAVTENIQREDLTPLEEGKIFCLMMDTMGMTLEQVAQAVKKSESYVRNRRRVAMAPEDIQEMVAQKPDSLRAVFYLLKVESQEERAKIIPLILQGKLIADEVDQYVKALKETTLAAPPQPREEIPQASPLATREVQSVDPPQESVSTQAFEPPAKAMSSKNIVGVSKLKTMLKAIKAYDHEQITTEEIDLIKQIADVAQRIQQRSQQ